MNEMKSTMEHINTILDQAQQRICEVEEKSFEIILSEEKKGKK